jgi:hypothetical protein
MLLITALPPEIKKAHSVQKLLPTLRLPSATIQKMYLKASKQIFLPLYLTQCTLKTPTL